MRRPRRCSITPSSDERKRSRSSGCSTSSHCAAGPSSAPRLRPSRCSVSGLVKTLSAETSPVPDHVAGTRQCESTSFDVGDDAVGDAAGEGMLHDGEADQHHDQHQAAEQRRSDDVVGDEAGDRKPCAECPDDKQQPGRNQQHGAVEAMGRQIDHQRQPEHGNAEKRHAGDAGGHRRIEHRHRDQRGQRRQPGDGDVGVAHMPAR